MLFAEQAFVHWHNAVKRFATYILALNGYNILFDRIPSDFLRFLVSFSTVLFLYISSARNRKPTNSSNRKRTKKPAFVKLYRVRHGNLTTQYSTSLETMRFPCWTLYHPVVNFWCNPSKLLRLFSLRNVSKHTASCIDCCLDR